MQYDAIIASSICVNLVPKYAGDSKYIKVIREECEIFSVGVTMALEAHPIIVLHAYFCILSCLIHIFFFTVMGVPARFESDKGKAFSSLDQDQVQGYLCNIPLRETEKKISLHNSQLT